MAHQQMCFHLAHSVEHHPDEDQHAGAAEEGGHRIGNLHFGVEQDGNNSNNGQKQAQTVDFSLI